MKHLTPAHLLVLAIVKMGRDLTTADVQRELDDLYQLTESDEVDLEFTAEALSNLQYENLIQKSASGTWRVVR